MDILIMLTTEFSSSWMKTVYASVYSYLSGISLWYFICPPTHQHFPVLPVGLLWVTVQPAQIISDSSGIQESLWPPRNPPTSHTWELTSASLWAAHACHFLTPSGRAILHHWHPQTQMNLFCESPSDALSALYNWPSWLWIWNNNVPGEHSGVKGLAEGDKWWLPSSPPGRSTPPNAHTLLLCPPATCRSLDCEAVNDPSVLPSSADLKPNKLQQRGMCC